MKWFYIEIVGNFTVKIISGTAVLLLVRQNSTYSSFLE